VAVRRARPADEDVTVPRTEIESTPPWPDLEVVPLCTRDQFDEATDLLCEVWGAESRSERNEVISSAMLRTLCHSGNYLSGAYRGDQLIGCSVGIFGSQHEGRPDHLHSYITGVLQPETNQGVGFALKCHQREWALERGIETITWTFDPLVRRNGHFNLCKLGATASQYEPDFYGKLEDGTNNADRTDRLVAVWRLRSEWIAHVTTGGPGRHRRYARTVPEARLIMVPPDIASLRLTDHERAQRSRQAAQDRFRNLLGRGFYVAGMSRNNEYVLLPPDASPAYES
jgi:predicted GNAT superfamily acetyltransferase